MNRYFYDNSYWSTTDIQKDELLHKLYDISIDALSGEDGEGFPKASISVNFGDNDIIYLPGSYMNIIRYPLRFIALEIVFPNDDAGCDIMRLVTKIKDKLSGSEEPVLLIEATDETGMHIMQADAPTCIFLGSSEIVKTPDRIIIVFNDDNVVFSAFAGEEDEDEEVYEYA